ncbi:sorting nexin [Anaeramoeba flamelloides]|uniref:Sorting nexin n=1 Tax=Anaeramoeba flamelloides TaxID=1746091 RepID=A0ABQ8Y626_9EUKA|nr:sorting nexin [Anaeramoeba flamelloides]
MKNLRNKNKKKRKRKRKRKNNQKKKNKQKEKKKKKKTTRIAEIKDSSSERSNENNTEESSSSTNSEDNEHTIVNKNKNNNGGESDSDSDSESESESESEKDKDHDKENKIPNEDGIVEISKKERRLEKKKKIEKLFQETEVKLNPEEIKEQEKRKKMLLEKSKQRFFQIKQNKRKRYKYKISLQSPSVIGKGMKKYTTYLVETTKILIHDGKKALDMENLDLEKLEEKGENTGSNSNNDSESGSGSENDMSSNSNSGSDSDSHNENENENENENDNEKKTKKEKKNKEKGNSNSTNDRISKFKVKRRYKDFIWIRNNLISDFPGVIVPTLPGKKIISKFESQFVEMRRTQLTLFLKRISEHPLLSLSRLFTMFLENDVDEIYKTKLNRKKIKLGIKRFHDEYLKYELDEKKQEELENKIDYWKNHGNCLKNIYAHTQIIRDCKEQKSHALVNFGQTILKLQQTETDIQDIHKLSEFLEMLHQIKDKMWEEIKLDHLPFEEILYEYYKISIEILNAYKTRNQIYNALQTAMKNQEKKTQQLGKAREKGSSNVNKLRRDYAKSRQLNESLKQQNKNVTAVLIDEMEKMKKQQQIQLKEGLLNFALAQKQVATFKVDKWKSIVYIVNNLNQEN